MTGWKNKYKLEHEYEHDRYKLAPYSTHSSAKELTKFIEGVRPRAIFFNQPEDVLDTERTEFRAELAKRCAD